MSRILAIDYGSKRSGIAVTDPMRIIASGLTTIATNELIPFLKKYTADENVQEIVIGQPKRMSNENSDIETDIQQFIIKLQNELPHISIEREDERFTSKMAFQAMLDGGMKKKQRQNKALIDEISATLILQSYMNRK
ncbi:Holliday junction resolvase RuvX [Capnocytophaga sp.]|uniref:Holliday junction resolvase RuvX n=1 Tax=Capnocytophaga sp. TaxID=44737 RepID=UPI0026DB4F36|nr:Holliday junction resolvase RuvX [Capnocytophaga sp.]MDO5104576.1 Holliday junction resolvase RuvX [Capnocytophaga sp.]